MYYPLWNDESLMSDSRQLQKNTSSKTVYRKVSEYTLLYLQ